METSVLKTVLLILWVKELNCFHRTFRVYLTVYTWTQHVLVQRNTTQVLLPRLSSLSLPVLLLHC
jgi:hypothetical protein